jgi:DNA excision repair protein ERCC-6
VALAEGYATAARSTRRVGQILDGRRHALYGIDILRKICNHPDLVRAADDRDHNGNEEEEEEKEEKEEEDAQGKLKGFGAPTRSGKLQVLASLLPLWRRQGHRALLFCQTRQMLSIVQRCVHRWGVSVPGFLCAYRMTDRVCVCVCVCVCV